MNAPGRVDALCLTCGTVRSVAAGYLGSLGERRLKCAACRQTTMHGSAAGVSDHRERANQRAILRTEDPWAVIEARGWQVIDVPNLKDHACLVRDQRLLLVRAGIDQATVDWAVAWALEQIEQRNTR